VKLRKRIVFASAAALWLAAGLAGCGSTSAPARFHSLVPAVGSAAAATTRAAPGVRFEVLPVTVPAQVDVPQIVVRLPDESMTALEHERWIAPLADEIRSAVTLRIEAALTGAPAPADADRPWRVKLAVERFDSTLGGTAGLQALWSLQQPGSGAAVRCRVSDQQAVAAGAAALAAGHRVMLERLGDAIGRALRAAAAGGVPVCG
jgi:uncharacterized lipoprotein YmbA